MNEITTALSRIEEITAQLKDLFDDSQMGDLGRALKQALSDSNVTTSPQLLLELDRAVKSVINQLIRDEIGTESIAYPKGFAGRLQYDGLAEYAQLMSKTILELEAILPKRILEQTIKRLVTGGYLPRRVTLEILEEYPTLPLFIAAHCIRQKRKLRGGIRKSPNP